MASSDPVSLLLLLYIYIPCSLLHPLLYLSVMDKSSSVMAALNVGKLPSTQQFGDFVNWLRDVGIINIKSPAQAELSSQGRLLSNDVRRILDAYTQFLNNKNGLSFPVLGSIITHPLDINTDDNILQEMVWNLKQGDLVPTTEAKEDREQALRDIHSLQQSLLVILKVAYNNVTTEGTHIFSDFTSVVRLMLADAAELVEVQAGKAKETLRQIEHDVQEGNRNTLAKDKEQIEAERNDARVNWEHGMDTVKGAGSMLVGVSQNVAGAVEDNVERTVSRLQDALYSVLLFLVLPYFLQAYGCS